MNNIPPKDEYHVGELEPPESIVDREFIGKDPKTKRNDVDESRDINEAVNRRKAGILLGGAFIALIAVERVEPRTESESRYSSPYHGGKAAVEECVNSSVATMKEPLLANIAHICGECREALVWHWIEHPCETSTKDGSPDAISQCKGERMEISRGAKDYCDSVETSD